MVQRFFSAELSAVASNELRGEQLLMQVAKVLAISGTETESA